MHAVSIDIIIPTYQGGSNLIRLIESILNQTYQEFNIIIIDNCSDIENQNVLNELSKHKKITVLNNDKNIGAFRNVASALKFRSKYYHQVLADDMVLEPTYLDATISRYNFNSDYIAVYSGVYLHHHDGTIITHYDQYSLEDDCVKKRLLSLAENLNIGTSVYSLFNSRMLSSIDSFWPYNSFMRFGDSMFLTMLLSKSKIHQVKEPLIHRYLVKPIDNYNLSLESRFFGWHKRLTLPLIEGVFRHYLWLKGNENNSVFSEEFILEFCSKILQRRQHEVNLEITRAIQMIEGNRYNILWDNVSSSKTIKDQYILPELLSVAFFTESLGLNNATFLRKLIVEKISQI